MIDPLFRVRSAFDRRSERRKRSAGTHTYRPSPSCKAFVTRAKFGELSKLPLPSLTSFVCSFLLRFAISVRSEPLTIANGPKPCSRHRDTYICLGLGKNLVTILEGGECVWGYTTERGRIHRAWRDPPSVEGSPEGAVGPEGDPDTRGGSRHARWILTCEVV